MCDRTYLFIFLLKTCLLNNLSLLNSSNHNASLLEVKSQPSLYDILASVWTECKSEGFAFVNLSVKSRLKSQNPIMRSQASKFDSYH